TILFSATQTRKTEDLIRLSFSSKPHFVSVDEKAVEPTREDLEQGYIVISAAKKLLLLFSFIKKYRTKKKIIVFFATINVTKYFVDLFNYIDLPVYGLF
ncbi:ATP-dependent RNA helicase DDX18, partial [Reticulomyxa filosa]